MKLRQITLIFTILMVLLIVVICRLVEKDAFQTVDVPSLNAKYNQIVMALNAGENRDNLEELYDCQIYLKTDSDYASKVMYSIKNDEIGMDYMTEDILLGKIFLPGKGDLFAQLLLTLKSRMIYICIFILLVGYFLIGIIYYFYIRPFQNLEYFAKEIAKGNMDVPLSIHKRDYFGVFTESFDLMREELKIAKENEYKANISKKELVAELSHDMKTPVATIKATCEVLKMKLLRTSSNAENNYILEKVAIIENKSEMLDQLIGNMFHATLEELENLPVQPQEEPSNLISGMLSELLYYENINVKNILPECLIYMDKLRFKQVVDNIVNNSYKYADTKIDVSFQEQAEGIIIKFRDYGAGVLEEELPLITQKYYRGSNGKGKSGAGIGLFIAKYFIEHMNGGMECYNDNGFVVDIFLRKV